MKNTHQFIYFDGPQLGGMVPEGNEQMTKAPSLEEALKEKKQEARDLAQHSIKTLERMLSDIFEPDGEKVPERPFTTQDEKLVDNVVNNEEVLAKLQSIKLVFKDALINLDKSCKIIRPLLVKTAPQEMSQIPEIDYAAQITELMNVSDQQTFKQKAKTLAEEMQKYWQTLQSSASKNGVSF